LLFFFAEENRIWDALANHQEQIPLEGLARAVAEYYAGMTDVYSDRMGVI
jgi:dGTP triphosphohydrolase